MRIPMPPNNENHRCSYSEVMFVNTTSTTSQSSSEDDCGQRFRRRMSSRRVDVEVTDKAAGRRKQNGNNSYNGDDSSDFQIAYLVLIALTVACYLNGFNGEFVHDDIPAITMNRDVLGMNFIASLFKNDFWGTSMSDLSSHKSYRPLTTLTFRLNNYLFGLKPLWFHLVNVALHAFVCILFTRICHVVAGLRRPFAVLAGVIFAIHPIHTEAVSGIVGRADVLACMFFLMSLHSYHSGHRKRSHVFFSILYGGLSMLAKETGITVFLVNLGFDFYKKWPFLKRSWLQFKWNKETWNLFTRFCYIVFFILVFLAIRVALLQGSLPKFSQQDNPAAFHPDISVRIFTFSYLAAFNWWLILSPVTLSHDWQMGSIPLLVSWADSRNLLTLAALLLLITMAVRGFFDLEKHLHMPLILGFLMLTMPFLPASNMIVTVGFVVAERVLYIPSLGSILIVVYGLQLIWHYLPSCNKLLASLGVVLLVTFSTKTVLRNEDWLSRESLLRSGLKVLPHNAKMHYNFGNFLRDTYQPKLAIYHYETALDLWPTYSSAHNNLGTLVEEPEQAEMHFLEAIRYSSGHLNAHFNLGQLYKRTNRTVKAVQILERCINLDPKFLPAYIELLKLSSGRQTESLLRQIVHLSPLDQSLLYLFGRWLFNRGLHQKALPLYLKAWGLDEVHRSSFLGACRSLRKLGQKSRLLQVVYRWQQVVIGPTKERKFRQSNIYLREWMIRVELEKRAKIYDGGPVKDLYKSPTTSTPIDNHSKAVAKTGAVKKGKSTFHIMPSVKVICNKTATQRRTEVGTTTTTNVQCTAEKKQQKQKASTKTGDQYHSCKESNKASCLSSIMHRLGTSKSSLRNPFLLSSILNNL